MSATLRVAAAATLVLTAALVAASQAGGDRAELRPGEFVAAGDLPRYGLNLGGSGTWGAEQLRANILPNPGFEPILDRTIVVVREAAGNRIVDDTAWLARGDGFWNGAQVEFRTGAAAGRGARVLESRKRASDGLAEFVLDRDPSGVAAGDIASVTALADESPAPLWRRGGAIAAVAGDVRPGSAGAQAVRLSASAGQPAELIQYFDNLAERAGKLLPVSGPWRVTFWAKALYAPRRVKVYFGRSGQPPFLEREVVVGTEWSAHELRFDARDEGAAGALTFSLKVEAGEVLLDDASLGEARPGAGGFRQAVVETVKAMRPGYLRDWQGQLGDTLDNRTADPSGRLPSRYRPGEHEVMFHYSLPELFALCAEVGASPWVVAPTTLDDDEWRRLGAFLRQAAERHAFRQILVEFGNENWNLIFRPAGILDPARHAAAADRAFRLLREGAGDDARIVTLVNAQFVNPQSPRRIGELSRTADRVAVAPYFLYTLQASQSAAEGRRAAFAEEPRLIREEAAAARSQNKRLSAYEVNFHTTLGDASSAQRDAIVTAAASGPALARRLIDTTLAGVEEQAVYVLSGFDNFVHGRRDLVRLWGVTRDLARAGNLRPTGIALQMLNEAAGGKARAVACDGGACAALTAIAYSDGQSLAVVSARDRPTEIEAAMICAHGSVRLALLDGSDAALNNEHAPQVQAESSRRECRGDRVRFRLPPYSLAVLRP